MLSGTVTGQITDTSGAGLSDARVHLVSSAGGSALFATTDSSGDYTIDNVADGSYVVKARDKGYVPNASDSFTVSDGDNTAPTVQLTAVVYGTVTGQVTDSSGNPLSDALVRLVSASANSSTTAGTMRTNFMDNHGFGLVATTDSNGDYTINNVLAGSYTVTARDNGYTPNTSASFTVGSGTTSVPAVQLTAIVYGTVDGEVTDSSGDPLTDAQVLLTPVSSSSSSSDPSSTFGGGRFFATTDSSGDYVINNVPAGTYTVTARDQGYVKNTSANFTVTTGSNTAPTVALSTITFGTVTGTVTDTSGNDLANAWVTLTPASSSGASPDADPSFGGGPGGNFGGPHSVLMAQTNSSGVFTINNVVAGTYTVTVHDQGYVTNTSASFTVSSGSNTAPTVALTAISYGTVDGQVTDANGTGLSGALVFLLPQNGNTGGSMGSSLFFLPPTQLFATTDSSGDYVINDVPAGSYEVEARDRGYSSNTSAAFTVASGDNTAPTVALSVSSTTNNPLPPFPIFGGGFGGGNGQNNGPGGDNGADNGGLQLLNGISDLDLIG
ncbi:MAG TPA: carboxypeptidase-like regulatory domain-containing protein [Tepidisphaeraceae bacterium]|nr:carboxypeptidase-like regulatory domain-containing protein [Tepidisphaeraceae bacterium]